MCLQELDASGGSGKCKRWYVPASVPDSSPSGSKIWPLHPLSSPGIRSQSAQHQRLSHRTHRYGLPHASRQGGDLIVRACLILFVKSMIFYKIYQTFSLNSPPLPLLFSSKRTYNQLTITQTCEYIFITFLIYARNDRYVPMSSKPHKLHT